MDRKPTTSQVIVFENGSSCSKVGFSGESAPQNVFPSIVGRPGNPLILGRMGLKKYYAGNEVAAKSRKLVIKYPIEHGIITNWDAMEKVWHYSFYNQLSVAPEEHYVILTEPPLNPKANRERMTQIMFETFSVRGIHINMNSLFALYASGKTSGVVLDSGDSVTHAVPIYEGFPISHAISRLDIGGRDLDDYLMKLLDEEGHLVTSNAFTNIMQEIKERVCYVAQDFEAELDVDMKTISMDHELQNGNIISIEHSRFRCPEALFQPILIGNHARGVHEIVYQSILRCNSEIQSELFRGIVLTGGSTLFEGFAERLEREIISLTNASVDLNVVGLPERKHFAWIGASECASQPEFEQSIIKMDEYDKFGPSSIHKLNSKGLVLEI